MVNKMKKMNEGLKGKKIISVENWWITLDDGTKAHIDFMLYK